MNGHVLACEPVQAAACALGEIARPFAGCEGS
jgi:hypothetical protein